MPPPSLLGMSVGLERYGRLTLIRGPYVREGSHPSYKLRLGNRNRNGDRFGKSIDSRNLVLEVKSPEPTFENGYEEIPLGYRWRDENYTVWKLA